MARFKAAAQPGRTHDCLYDPNFHVATEKDHRTAVMRANHGKITIVPHHPNMFSEIPTRYPGQTLKLGRAEPVPAHVPRDWPDAMHHYRDKVETFKKHNYAPHIPVPPKEFEAVQPNGKDGYRYFHRPVIPYLQALKPTAVLFQAATEPSNVGAAMMAGPYAQPRTRTVAVQTDYRDSEAQTDPWSPEHRFLPGTEPEELLLHHLTFKNRGLPAGIDAVELVERSRMKRAWEKTLPDADDGSKLEKRRAMMEAQEAETWAYREKKIEQIQEARMAALKRGLEEKEERNRATDVRKMARRWKQQKKEKMKKVKSIQHHHRIGLRQLEGKHSNPENELKRRDIVTDYDDPGSKVFVPLTRGGVFADCVRDQDRISSRFLSTYRGILQLESELPTFLTEPQIHAPPRPSDMKGSKAARQRKYAKDLQTAFNAIHEPRTSAPAGSMRLLEKIEKPKIRPPTPTVSAADEDEAELEQCIVDIQTLMRGLGRQSMMAQEVEDARVLIDEVKIANALQRDKAPLVNGQHEQSMADQKAVETMMAFGEDVDMVAEDRAQEDMGIAVDFYNKELHRLQEERRIHALILVADRERRMKEAAEAGQRQKEALNLKRDDEVFRQLVSVQQTTVQHYLESFIVLPSIEENATEAADNEIQEMVQAVNNFNASYEKRTEKVDALELASRLVHTFLIPEPEKAEQRRRVRQDQERFLKCAHDSIYDQSREILQKHLEQPPDSTDAAPPPRDGPARGGDDGTGT